jgi:hypothetical protein
MVTAAATHYPSIFGPQLVVIDGSLSKGVRISETWLVSWRNETEQTKQMSALLGDHPMLKYAPSPYRFDGTSSGEVVLKAGGSIMGVMGGSDGSCWVWSSGQFDAETRIFVPDIESLQVDYCVESTAHREVFSGEKALDYLLGDCGWMMFSAHLKSYIWTREDAYDWVRFTAGTTLKMDPDAPDFKPNQLCPPFDFERYLPK